MNRRQFGHQSNLVKATINGVATFVTKQAIKAKGQVRHGTALGVQVNSPTTMQHQGGVFLQTDDGQAIGMATPDFLVAAAAVLTDNGYEIKPPAKTAQ